MSERWGNKRGQVTIFIIVGMIIVGLGVLIYLFYPPVRSVFGGGEQSPTSYIQTCLEDEIENAAAELSLKGGSINPEFYTVYEREEVEYLCYTGDNRARCIVQQPALKQHIEEEIKNAIEEDVTSCFASMKSSFEKKGYDTSLTSGSREVELLPNRIVGTFNYSFTMTKSSTEKYDSFSVVVNNNLYELVAVATSIVEWEATYGDIETTLWESYYHDLRIEKKAKSDGSKIYIITDLNTGNKFQFASRSVVMPGGYGD